MSKIIISYRVADTKSIAGRLHDFLDDRYGSQNVSFGVDKLVRPGDDFQDAIEDGVRGADLLIVMIGSRWLEGDWLLQSNDYDRIALLAGINAKKRVLPVLVEGATLPSADALPPEMASVLRRSTLPLSDDNFRAEAAKIIELVPLETPQQPKPAAQPVPPPQSTPQSSASDYRRQEAASSGSGYSSLSLGEFEFSRRSSFSEPESPSQDKELPPSSGLISIDALGYPFRDPEWLSKIAIAALINIIPVIGQLFLAGYGVRVARRVQKNKDGLPAWDDWGNDFSRGIVMLVGSFLHGVVVIGVYTLVVVVISRLLLDQISTRSSVSSLLAITTIGSLIFSLIYSGMLTIAVGDYIAEERLGVFFGFVSQLGRTFNNLGRIILLAINGLIYGVIMGIAIGFGLALLVIPGLFLIAATLIGSYFILGRWTSYTVRD